MCLVYLVPDGARIEDLVFEPTEGYDPITWTGDVQEPASRSARPRRRAARLIWAAHPAGSTMGAWPRCPPP